MAARTIPPAAETYLRNLSYEVMDQCDRHGVTWQDFSRELSAERVVSPSVSPEELFRRTFLRFGVAF